MTEYGAGGEPGQGAIIGEAAPSRLMFGILNTARVRGFVPVGGFERSLNTSSTLLSDELDECVTQGTLRRLTGRAEGFTLTADGRAQHDVALRHDRLSHATAYDALSDLYETFVPLNKRFKRTCTDWQLRPEAGTESTIANDHSDQDYDATVLLGLDALHLEATQLCERFAQQLTRFENYGPRLIECILAIHRGDLSRFTGVQRESYHDVWMELHQDLIVSLELERGPDDA